MTTADNSNRWRIILRTAPYPTSNMSAKMSKSLQKSQFVHGVEANVSSGITIRLSFLSRVVFIQNGCRWVPIPSIFFNFSGKNQSNQIKLNCMRHPTVFAYGIEQSWRCNTQLNAFLMHLNMCPCAINLTLFDAIPIYTQYVHRTMFSLMQCS